MKIIDLINKVNPNEDYYKDSLNIESLGTDLGISIEDIYDIEDAYWRLEEEGKFFLKAIFVARHYCTDSYVGDSVLFLGNEPAALISQVGRKCPREYKWISQDYAEKAREYLLSLVKKKDLKESITVLDGNLEVDDLGYKIDYAEQLLEKSVFYNNKRCKVLNVNPHREIAGETILIQEGTKSKEVSIRDCIIPYNLEKEDS